MVISACTSLAKLHVDLNKVKIMHKHEEDQLRRTLNEDTPRIKLGTLKFDGGTSKDGYRK